jgi:hypothetical protein
MSLLVHGPGYLGDFNPGDTVDFTWSTCDSTGTSVTRATNGTVSVYRNDDLTQFTGGVTDTEDADFTGNHLCHIDLSNSYTNFAYNANYTVRVTGMAIGAISGINAVLAHFSIGKRSQPGLMLRTTIATWTSNTDFTLTDGSSFNTAYRGHVIVLRRAAAPRLDVMPMIVLTYTGSTKTITTAESPVGFTFAAGDHVEIYADYSLKGIPLSRVALQTRGTAGVGRLDADVIGISTSTAAADNAEAFFDGTGYAGGTIKLGVNAAQWLGSDIVVPATNGIPSVQPLSLGTQAKADVNAEVLDVLVTDTHAEPASVPAATSSLKDKIGWLFMLGRNKRTQTSSTENVRNDADSATIGTSTKSDDGTTFTRGKYS